jgi:RNA polymerase sigma factor (TIGR02999 family)
LSSSTASITHLEPEAKSVTVLLRDWRQGDADALNKLVPIVYDELRRLAARFLRDERAGHTLRPTDLVSEAYLRLIGAHPHELNDRAHFLAIAAVNMRQILVDHARKRSRAKRGGGQRPITLADDVVAVDRPEELVALDDALIALAVIDARKARVVELSYFSGLSQAEIAEVVGVHVNTIARDLHLAEAWLHRHIREAP